MGFAGKLESVNSFSRSLFWRVRAAVKNAVKNNQQGRKKFQYDPSSYALNFDDGSRRFSSCSSATDGGIGYCCYPLKVANNADDGSTDFITIWVYVVWVESFSS